MGQVRVEDVREALKRVVDPELGLNVVEAGFIRDISVEGGQVVVKMMLTSPFCPLIYWLISEVEEAVKSVKGVTDVRVEIVGFGIPPELEELMMRRIRSQGT